MEKGGRPEASGDKMGNLQSGILDKDPEAGKRTLVGADETQI